MKKRVPQPLYKEEKRTHNSVRSNPTSNMNQLYDEESLQNIHYHMRLFTKVTELNCMLINDQGEVIATQGDSVDFCTIFQDATKNENPCQQAHLYASKQSEALGEPYIFFCPGGLGMITMALVNNDTFAGAILVGPIHINTPDSFTITNLIKSYSIEERQTQEIETAYRLIPLIHPGRTKYILELLGIFVKDILGEASSKLEKNKKIYQEQRVISEHIHTIKEQGKKLYPIELERTLITKIKQGDSKSGRAILNEILGYILFKYRGNVERVKSMLIELLVVMSRAAVDAGAQYEMILEANAKFYSEAFTKVNTEELCVLLTENLEILTDLIFHITPENREYVGFIKKATEYIGEHYAESISLEDVANHVHISPPYLSRLFPKITKIKYADYVNMVRVEESKKLLRSNYSLADIAQQVGFSDQSYYTKVFKKYNNISPGRFRKLEIQ